MKKGPIYLVFCLVCAVFGTTFLAIKLGVSAGAPPFLFAGLRFTAAGLILGLVLVAAGKARPRDFLVLAPRAALVSVFYIMANFGATFWAEQYIDSGTAAQIDAVNPLAAALLSALFLGRRFRPSHALGLALGFAGVWLIVRGAAGSAGAAGGSDLSLIASLVMLAGAVSMAGASILFLRLFDDTVSPFMVNSLNMFMGGLGLLALAAATGERSFPMTAGALLPLLYLVVAGSLVGHSANLWLIRKAGPVFASSWSYASPVIATVVGALVLGEKVSGWNIVGAVLTLTGVYVIARAETRAARSAAPSVSQSPAA